MKYRVYGHRHADYLFEDLEEYASLWGEITDALDSITDDMIIDDFLADTRDAKSISSAINRLIKHEMVERGWSPESYIFADAEYSCGAEHKGVWRLDFAKDALSVEVAFNHRSDISWNIIKPTLASELNHVAKAIQTSGGVIIAATEDMKAAGGFDNACGTWEDYVQYMRPMNHMLPTPLAIVGLEAPETFEIIVEPIAPRKKKGFVCRYAVMNLFEEHACPWCGCVLEDDAQDRCGSCGERVKRKP